MSDIIKSDAVKLEEGVKVAEEKDTSPQDHSKPEPNMQKKWTKGGYQKRQNNSKFDPTAKPVTDDPREIRRQADFYFSDSNLPYDQYLWDLTDGPANRPVKISKIHSFGRMRRFQPYSAVVAALRESQVLEVSGPEGSEEVKRKIPYDPNKKDPREDRIVYVKGFGEELPTTQFDIEAFFAQYGPTNSVRLRRTDDKLFKGSCWIEFQDEKTAQDFLALEPKPLWQGKDELKIMSKKDYQREKGDLIRDGKMEPSETRPPRGRGGGGRGGGFKGDRERRGGRDRDPDDWKKRREDDQKSGFRDKRRDRDSHGHGGKGGRGRGGGNNRDRRNNERNRERNDRDRVEAESHSPQGNGNVAPEAASKSEEQKPSTKRAREDDTIADEAPTKKLDQKEEVSVDTS